MEPRPTIPGYELIQELGRGGMGVVWLARQLSLDRLVALKMLFQGADDPVDRERFRREGGMLKDLAHPNLVRLYDHDVDAAAPYLVLEHVESARSLASIIAFDRPAIPRALELIQGAAAGLAYLHERGLIHRDVKPGNILVGRDERARLIDLGLARALDAGEFERLTAAGEVMGTVAYMAPEQMTGQDIDARSDVYALGLVLYELLARRIVFASREGGIPPQRRLTDRWPAVTHYFASIPPEVAAVVARCVQLDPKKRFADGGELAAALARVSAGVGARASSARAVPEAPARSPRPARPDTEPLSPPSGVERVRTAIALAVLGLAMVALLLAAFGPDIFLPGGSSRLFYRWTAPRSGTSANP